MLIVRGVLLDNTNPLVLVYNVKRVNIKIILDKPDVRNVQQVNLVTQQAVYSVITVQKVVTKILKEKLIA